MCNADCVSNGAFFFPAVEVAGLRVKRFIIYVFLQIGKGKKCGTFGCLNKDDNLKDKVAKGIPKLPSHRRPFKRVCVYGLRKESSFQSAALCLIPSILLLSFALAAQASYRFTTNYGGYRSGASRFAVPTAFAARAVPAVPTYEALSVAAPAVPTYEALPVAAAPAAPVAAPVYTAAALTYEAHPDPVPEPYTFAPAQPAAPAPAAPSVVSSQYHAQDELGHVEYGYSNVNSQKQESRDAYGNVQGSYREEPNQHHNSTSPSNWAPDSDTNVTS